MLHATNHTEAGDTVLSGTGMHVAGLLALRPLHALGGAVRLIYHTGVCWIVNPTLHAANLYSSIATDGALAIGASFVDVYSRYAGTKSKNSRSCMVYRISVEIQAHKLSMDQHLERGGEE